MARDRRWCLPAMADDKARFVIDDLRGGRNGFDPPLSLAKNEAADMVNVDLYQTHVARKRNGGVTFTTTSAPPVSVVDTLIRHVPGVSDSDAELWMCDSSKVITRMAAGTTFASPTIKDAVTGNPWDVVGLSINGLLSLAYDDGNGATGRHHVWDPVANSIRRAGIHSPTAPTVADGGGVGTYAAVLRYYRQRSTVQVGGITVRRSEATASVAFTPDGAHLNATITLGAGSSEGDTHFEIEASLDNATFYRITTVTVATATYADSAATTTYNTNPLSAATGVYTLQRPYKFTAGDQNRHLGYGSYYSADKQSRIEFSAVAGSLDVGDVERVDTTTNYFVDLDEADSGGPTGIGGPINGAYFAFKFKQTRMLTPTGQTSLPFQVTVLSKTVGCVAHKSICVAEDEYGRPAIYWMSHRGPYRYGANGLQYIGKGVADYILGPTATIYLVSPDQRLAHTIFHQDKRQVWFFVTTTTGFAAASRSLLIYDVDTGGWTRFTGTKFASAVCSVMFSNTPGATMSLDLKPYIGVDANGSSNTIFKYDTGTTDPEGNFQAYILTRAIEPGGTGFYGEVGNAVISAPVASGVTISTTAVGDYGQNGKNATGSNVLTAVDSETRVTRVMEGSALTGDLITVQHQVGDDTAVSNSWSLDRLIVPMARRGPVSQ